MFFRILVYLKYSVKPITTVDKHTEQDLNLIMEMLLFKNLTKTFLELSWRDVFYNRHICSCLTTMYRWGLTIIATNDLII